MATVEVLRIQRDSLQWEVNRLQAENRRLKDDHPEAGRAVALEEGTRAVEERGGDADGTGERMQSRDGDHAR